MSFLLPASVDEYIRCWLVESLTIYTAYCTVSKIPRIRAALCHDTYSAHQCVEHDDVNVLCIGAWVVGIRVAEEVLRAFLNAEFSTDAEFRRRVDKLAVLEQEAIGH